MRAGPNYIVQPCVRSQFRPTLDRRLVVRPSLGLSALSVILGALFSSPEGTATLRILRPTSFLSRPGGPTWTSRRPTRSGQLRPPWGLRWICYAWASFPQHLYSCSPPFAVVAERFTATGAEARVCPECRSRPGAHSTFPRTADAGGFHPVGPASPTAATDRPRSPAGRSGHSGVPHVRSRPFPAFQPQHRN